MCYFRATYQLCRGPIQRHVTQHITNNVHKPDTLIGEGKRLRNDEFARFLVEVMGDFVCLAWGCLQHTQNLLLIVLALCDVIRRKEESVTTFIQGVHNPTLSQLHTLHQR